MKKLSSSLASMLAFAAAASGIASSAASTAQSIRSFPTGPSRTAGKCNPAGTKLLKAMEKHNLGLGIHRNSKHPIEGVTFSPKKDIGKGPAQTLSKRERQLLTGQKRITQRHHYYDLATARNLEAKLRYL